MIVFDTETTGLPNRGSVPLSKQPHIIEFAAIKFDDESLEEVDRIEFLCKPPLAMLDPVITKITGITMQKVIRDDGTPSRYLSDKLPFKAYFSKLSDFFLGERKAYAHNMSFDLQMMGFEMERLEKTCKFPWVPDPICTVEKTYKFKNHRLKLIELYEYLFGKTFEGAHEAMNDVEALSECVIELIKRGDL